MIAKRFPVSLDFMPHKDREEYRDCPESVDWDLVAPHEAQAQRNHDQTLNRLAERGGLSPSELVTVLEDREWRVMPLRDAVNRLKQLIGWVSK